MATRGEHLQWCKNRAVEYAYSGDLSGAVTSMMSDLGKHQETQNHPGIQLAMMMLMTNNLKTVDATIKFINGFN